MVVQGGGVFLMREVPLYTPCARRTRNKLGTNRREALPGRACLNRFKLLPSPRKVDVRLPGKESSNSHGTRPVHLIITMIKWIRTSSLSITKSLSMVASRSGAAGTLSHRTYQLNGFSKVNSPTNPSTLFDCSLFQN